MIKLGLFTPDSISTLFKINVRQNSLPQILLLTFSRSTSAGILYPGSCFCLFQDQRPPEFFTSNPASAFFKINIRRVSLSQILLLPFLRSTSAENIDLKSCFCLFKINIRRFSLSQSLYNWRRSADKQATCSWTSPAGRRRLGRKRPAGRRRLVRECPAKRRRLGGICPAAHSLHNICGQAIDYMLQ